MSAPEPEDALPFSETLLSAIGHDLRNPLHAIVAAAQLLLRRETDPQTTAPLNRIVNGAQRIEHMVQQLLDVARDEIVGRIPIAPEPVDLGALVAQVIEGLPPQARSRVVVAPVGDVRGKWDAERLSQVVAVLLDNAIAHGSEAHPVRLGLDGSERDVIRLEVWNRGVISDDVRPHLFEPFHGALGAARARKPRGIGLGLYLGRRIVEAHRGRIEARSSEESGTSVWVSLPRISFAPEDDDEDNDDDVP